jgi:hypothetical protein
MGAADGSGRIQPSLGDSWSRPETDSNSSIRSGSFLAFKKRLDSDNDSPSFYAVLAEDKAAIAVAERFITLHPDHKRVPEAMYRRAEGELNAKNYSQAVLRFQEVIDKHKSSPWAAYAMLRQGECFEA